MNVFLVNMLLALVWFIAMGKASVANLFTGFVVSYALLWWVKPIFAPTRYFEKLPQAARFILFFLWELVKSNLRVAWDVVTPRARRRPGIIAVPLSATTDAEITLLANVITLTPGTLSLDVSTDRRVLYVHTMFVDDPEKVVAGIKDGFERRVLELLR